MGVYAEVHFGAQDKLTLEQKLLFSFNCGATSAMHSLALYCAHCIPTYSGYQHDLERIPWSSCGDLPPQGSCLLPPTGWTP